MALPQPPSNWADTRPGEEPPYGTPEWYAWKAVARQWRQNAAKNQAWQDEQLGIRDDIVDEASLARALDEMGIFNIKEEGKAGRARIMSRGMGYQRNLINQNRDYYSNLWNREGLRQLPNGIWEDVRPNGSILYRDSMGYLTDANGRRTGGHYIGTPYRYSGTPGYSGGGGSSPGAPPPNPPVPPPVPPPQGGPPPGTPSPPQGPNRPTPQFPPGQGRPNPRFGSPAPSIPGLTDTGSAWGGVRFGDSGEGTGRTDRLFDSQGGLTGGGMNGVPTIPGITGTSPSPRRNPRQYSRKPKRPLGQRSTMSGTPSIPGIY